MLKQLRKILGLPFKVIFHISYFITLVNGLIYDKVSGTDECSEIIVYGEYR